MFLTIDSLVFARINTGWMSSASQEELRLLQRQLEERELELKRLKDGGERGGLQINNPGLD